MILEQLLKLIDVLLHRFFRVPGKSPDKILLAVCNLVLRLLERESLIQRLAILRQGLRAVTHQFPIVLAQNLVQN